MKEEGIYIYIYIQSKTKIKKAVQKRYMVFTMETECGIYNATWSILVTVGLYCIHASMQHGQSIYSVFVM